jgi:hypothetical protein
MKKQILPSPDEIARLEQKLKNSSLDESTIAVIKELIADQTFLLDLVAKLIEASGHDRSKVIKEIAKVLEIDLKQK